MDLSIFRFSIKGFTLVELMVVMVIVSIIITSIIGVMLSTRKTAKWSEVLIEAQQNARFACDVMAADIRCAGYGIDASLVQGAIVYAGPFEIIFNANMTPYPDTTPPQEPAAINIDKSPKNVPPGSSPVHYLPGQTFNTGAETIRYTIDYNDDGVISATDKTSPEAVRTKNPNDYLLIKQVYGELWDGTNGGQNQELAVIRGPDVWPGQTTGISPLFEYWLDHDNDPTTPDVLFGDTDNSGDLSIAEINALNTQVPNPDRITRVTINVIGETREPHSGENYRSVKMTTAINTLRNNPPKFRLITGHVYLDDGNGIFEDEVGVDSILVSLHTAQTCYTGLGGLLQGMYEFSVLPGSYTVKVTIPAGYALTTASSFVAYAKTQDVDSTSANLFGLKTVALGYLTGVVFDDSLCTNGEWDPDSGEQTIPGVQISVTSTHQVAYTDSTGHYFFKVNAGEIFMHVVTEADPDSYISTAAQTIPSAGAFCFPLGPNDVRFWVMEGCTAKINFGDKKGASGKIKGFVFEDVGTVVDSLYEPEDGDVGIPNVKIEITQGIGASETFVTSTITDVDGSFSVIVPINPIPDPTYNVLETDPDGFNSINLNRVEGLEIPDEGDSVIVRPFADKRIIIISLKGRALTVITPDLMEDTYVDNDIVMGKGINGENLLVWYNGYLSPGNPPPQSLFNVNRDDARTCDKTIYALSANPINDDNLPDVVSVMDSHTDNIRAWFTRTGPPKKYQGKLPDIPDKIYSTISAGEKVMSVATGLLGTPRADIFFNDNYFDVAVGTRKGVNSGVLEVWLNQRPDSIALLATAVDVYQTAGASDLGEVKGIAIANVVGAGGGAPDGWPDIILATITGANTGEIVIFRNTGTPGPGNFSWYKTLPASGEVNCVAVLDLLEDANNDRDIVIGTKTGDWTGKVEIWHNNNDGTFGNADTLATYTAEAGGAVQCIGVTRLCPDVYPDIVVGLKTSVDYTGKVLLYDLAYGRFPGGGPTDPAGGFYTGEMVTLSIADFDKDGKNDFIIGERTSATVGHLLIFFQ